MTVAEEPRLAAGAPRVPHLDARLSAAAHFVRPGHTAADIGCDHGKLSAFLAGSGRCPRIIACDLRPGPLQKARAACAPWADRIDLRLGDGLSVLQPDEADDLVIAGMGAETIAQILAAAPWVFDARYNLVLVPTTKHTVLRRWLAQNGFALTGETLCTAAGRWYAVMNARYTGEKRDPPGLWCLCGTLRGQPGVDQYRAAQLVKMKKYRRGLEPGPQAQAVDELIHQMEENQWP